MAHTPRLYRPGRIAAGPITLDAEQSKRLASVLRVRPGEGFLLFAGDGREWRASVTSVVRNAVHGEVHEIVRQAPANTLTLEVWCALVRANRFELAIEKCTEAGVDIIRPMVTDHIARGDQPSDSRLERWSRIAIEAAEQSGRLYIPVIAKASPFTEALRQARHPLVFADLGGRPWRETAKMLPQGGRLGIAVGPEGGWSDAERAAARSAGSLVTALGDTVLRTETAAIVATALVRASV